MASTGHSNGRSPVAREETKDCKLSLKENLKAMHKIASEQVTDKARKAPHYDPDPEPMKFGQQVVLRSQTPVPAAVLAKLHSLYKNSSTVATELLATVMQDDETDPRNTYHRWIIRTRFEEKLRKEAQLSGIFPTDQDLTGLTQELFERFFAIYGVPQSANLELLGEAGDIDDDILEIWFAHKFVRFRGCLHASLTARRAKIECRRHWDDSWTSEPRPKKSLLRH